jgi:hypothetical protein
MPECAVSCYAVLCRAEQVEQQQQAELRAKMEANRLTLQEAQRDLSIKMEQYEEEVSCTACRASVSPSDCTAFHHWTPTGRGSKACMISPAGSTPSKRYRAQEQYSMNQGHPPRL